VTEFEKTILKTFKSYRDAGIAQLTLMWPPMRMAGLKGRVPCFVQVGTAPYDVVGHYLTGAATHIGVELKETRERETSIAIVGPGKKGSGLQWHQLVGLVQLHQAGGVALLVWDNGGEVGVLTGDQLHLAMVQYETSMKAEKSKRTPAKGSRSILWGHFTPVKYGVADLPLFLPPAPKCKGVA
jgi:hypothetical protein